MRRWYGVAGWGAVRVAYVVESSWHRVPGGTAVAMLALARGLLEAGGVDLVGVAAAHRRPAPAAFALPEGMAVGHLPLPRKALYESWHLTRRPAVERVTGPVHLVHATYLAVPPRSAPLVVTVHDLAPLTDPEHFTRRNRRLTEQGIAIARDEADLVCGPSEATLRDCAANGVDPARLRLVPWGVAATASSPEAVAAVRARLGVVRPYLLFAGTLEPRKNLPRLLEAYAEVHDALDVDLVLAGPAGWGEEVRLPAEVAARVRPLGFVSRADLDPLYAGATAVVYPSLREGFGLPVLEAMAQGAAVVTSKGTATEEAAGGAAVLVDPRDVTDIARGIAEAVARREELAPLALARAATATWGASAAAQLAAYRELTG
jgi:glycosyltransferase involved in cell wall biosynthesis